MMADRRSRMRRRALLLAPLAALAAAHLAAACTTHCDGGVCTDSSEARFIDRVCSQRATEGPICEVDGGAVQTTGLTGDTLGFHLGDAGGTLTIHLQALEGVRQGSTFDIELLMASTDAAGTRIDATLDWGSCGEGCPLNPPIFDTTVTPDYHWVAVEIGQLTATTNKIPYDATLRLEGKSIDIADLRVSSISPELACSIRGPIGAR